MGIMDVLIKGLAIWGGLLSTILGVREFVKYRKRIKIYLEYLAWQDIMQLTIINTGFRPITIAEIATIIHHSPDDDNHGEDIRTVDMFAKSVPEKKLPITIESHDYVSLHFSKSVNHLVLQDKKRISVKVIDIEGKIFDKVHERTHDVKWGYYENGLFR